MFAAYVLENPRQQWYIGKTDDINRRLKEHNSSCSYTTKRLKGPWKLIYCELCLNEWDAKKRERFLKTAHGREYLTKRIHYYLNS